MPPPVTDTVPLRLDVPVFAVALTVTLPLLAPDAGERVSQLWLALTVQFTFAVTAIAAEEGTALNDSEVGETVRLLPPPPHMLSTSVASLSPLPEPAAFSAMQRETSGAYVV